MRRCQRRAPITAWEGRALQPTHSSPCGQGGGKGRGSKRNGTEVCASSARADSRANREGPRACHEQSDRCRGSGTRAGSVQAEFAQFCGKPMATDGRAKLQPQNNSRERVIRVVGGCGSKASGGRQRMESGQGEEERSARPQGMSATVIWQVQSNTAAVAVKFQCGCDSAFAIGLLGSVVRPGGEACPVGSARGAGSAPIGLRHAFANHAAAETCVSAAACGGAPMRSVRHKGRKVRPALSVTELSFGEGLKAGCRPSAAREPARSWCWWGSRCRCTSRCRLPGCPCSRPWRSRRRCRCCPSSG